jgi:hypothetical protein
MRLISDALGGCSIANWVALKTHAGATVGQFMLNRLQQKIIASGVTELRCVLISQGEADSTTSAVADTYAGGPIAFGNKFGNNATGLLSGVANPVYSWLSPSVEMVATVTAAGGFFFYRSYEAAFKEWCRLLRLLQNAAGDPVLPPTAPIIVMELARGHPGTEYRRNDFFSAIANECSFDPYVFVVPSADVPVSRVQSGGAYNNVNHWSSPGLNELGSRAFDVLTSLRRAPLPDVMGGATAPRLTMRIINNVETNGRVQSVDNTYYDLSVDQLRNGTTLQLDNTTLIIPDAGSMGYPSALNAAGGYGGSVDLELIVLSVASGPSFLVTQTAAAGMGTNEGPITLGGRSWPNKYRLGNTGNWRLSSRASGWGLLTLLALPNGGAINATGHIGIQTPSPTALLDIAGSTTVARGRRFTATIDSSATDVQYGEDFRPAFTPAGATLGEIRGLFMSPAIKSGPNVTNFTAYSTVLTLDPLYTGTITTGRVYLAGDAAVGGGQITNFTQFNGGAISNGNGLTTGARINRHFYGGGMSAGTANAAATIDNRGIHIVVPNGIPSAGRTWNSAIFVDGTGGGAAGTGTEASWVLRSESARLIQSAGGLVIGDSDASINPGGSNAYIKGTVRTGSYTVATLPTVGTAGRRAWVSDAAAATFGATVVGGGAIGVPVFDNGTEWIMG